MKFVNMLILLAIIIPDPLGILLQCRSLLLNYLALSSYYKKKNVLSTFVLVSTLQILYMSIHPSVYFWLPPSLPFRSSFSPPFVPHYLSLSHSLSLYLLCSWWVLASTPLHYDIMFAALSTAECLNVSYIVAAHSSQPYNTANANSLSA